ncbi:MAG: toxin-activating lysine-acyltransferase [Salaquimonas sp.]|nr:toxin-activating lysine-acyltransferase [Salaquimonas sp.]
MAKENTAKPVTESVETISNEDAVSGSPPVDPETLAKLAALRSRIHSTFAQVAFSMMNLPRYRHQTLADLGPMVLDPILHDRMAIAMSRPAGEDQKGPEATVGVAIWASVSDEVDRKIREQVKAGVFPTRLKADEWACGETVWLLDVIAPSQKLATAVLANFRQVAGEGQINLHPVVARLVDRELLKGMTPDPASQEERTVN